MVQKLDYWARFPICCGISCTSTTSSLYPVLYLVWYELYHLLAVSCVIPGNRPVTGHVNYILVHTFTSSSLGCISSYIRTANVEFST